MKRSRPENSSRRKGKAGSYPSIFQPSPFTDESRKKRAKQRRRHRLAGWPSRLLLLLVILLVLAALLVLLPPFTIGTVTVTGTRLTDEAGIRALAEVKQGKHFLPQMGGSIGRFLTLRYGGIEDEIQAAYPLIRQVRVRFRFPSILAVTVEEKVEIMALRVSGGYALIDRDREVLRLTEELDFTLPVLEGVSVLSRPESGRILEVEDPAQLTAASRLIAGLIQHDQADIAGFQLMQRVRQVRQITGSLFFLFIPLSQGGEIRVRLEDNRLLQDKLSLLAYLLEREDLLPQTAGELDLSGETAYFRPDAGGQASDFTLP